MINFELKVDENSLDDIYASILRDKIYRYLDLRCCSVLDVEEFNKIAEHLHIWLCYECAITDLPVVLSVNTLNYLDVILEKFKEKKGF